MMMTVLIVDDEQIAREGLRDLVDWGAMGMKVGACASNGKEALAWMEKHECDIVITDIRMPEMDGLELLRHMQEEGLDATAIILSGYSDFQYAQKAIQYGVLHYLLKPVHLDELEKALERAGAERARKRPAPVAPEESARFETRDRGRADEALLQLSAQIGSEQAESLEAPCRAIVRVIQESGYPLSLLKRYVFHAIYHLIGEAEKRSGKNDLEVTNLDILGRLSAAGTYAEVETCFIQYVTSLSRLTASYRDRKESQLVSRTISLLQHRYNESGLSLNTVADELEVTPNYLSALFKKETGQNFSDYLESLRIKKACMLLRDTQMKIYEVASAAGYSDPQHFAKVFKNVVGRTPKEYRNG